ncbi:MULTISPECIES: hypothetical protein [unclassified Nocardioides]|uniref:hypothetical protein n=1 Tax=unclassified Nocardioides TaxID=2615069 RepID=UPI0012E343EC|nr:MULTISPECIES: hypothetical protein [unclassified Nocardioides]
MSRRVDYDHPAPYDHDPTAPSAQTGVHNSALLGRYQHRVKTHAQFTVREPRPGTHVWRSPHKAHRLVDPTGTHPVHEALGDALVDGTHLEQRFAVSIAEHTNRV